jgi:hypothetical protein
MSGGRALALLLATLAPCGCRAPDIHELGFTQPIVPAEGSDASASDAGDAGDATRIDAGVVPTMPFRGLLSEFVGRWQGQAEDPTALELIANPTDALPSFRFPSGAATITLEVDPPRIELTFGAVPPLPPAESPAQGYPPGVDYWDIFTYFDDKDPRAVDDTRPLPPFEGFVYHGVSYVPPSDQNNLGEDTLPDGVLRIAFSTSEILDGWCALQFAYPVGGDSFSCLSGGQFTREGAGPCLVGDGIVDTACADAGASCDLPSLPADCNQALLCAQRRCECSAAGCRTARPTLMQELALRRTANGLTGAFNNALFLNERGLLVALGSVRLYPAN